MNKGWCLGSRSQFLNAPGIAKPTCRVQVSQVEVGIVANQFTLTFAFAGC